MEIRQIKPEERAAYGRLCSLCFTYPYRDESAAVEAETSGSSGNTVAPLMNRGGCAAA